MFGICFKIIQEVEIGSGVNAISHELMILEAGSQWSYTTFVL